MTGGAERRYRTEKRSRELDQGSCPDCGKVRYATRKVARRVAHHLYPGARMSAYQCGAYWHIGHTPTPIRLGKVRRASYRPNPSGRTP